MTGKKLPALQGSNRILGPARGESISVKELLQEGAALLSGKNGRSALLGASEKKLISALGGLLSNGKSGMIIPLSRWNDSVRGLLQNQGFTILATDAEAAQALSKFRQENGAQAKPNTEVEIFLLTSGTTAEGKLIAHTWESLITVGRVSSATPRRWLSTYLPGTYAWFQSVQMSFFVPGQDLVLAGERSVPALFQAADRHGVNAISATPTFWRMALLQIPSEELRSLGLRTLTLGGEPVEQDLLDQLKKLYPTSELAHIYASTEVGAAIVVKDAKAGFPSEWLGLPEREGRPELRVQDGTLWVRSAHASQACEGWFDTGDVVEIREGRAHIVGRKSGLYVNVGGAKVATHQVESILRAHPAIRWCRVFGKAAPIVGRLVAAEVVADSPVSDGELTRFCQERMEEHMIPRIWMRLDGIPASVTWKAEAKAE